jgi:hypothetical protein
MVKSSKMTTKQFLVEAQIMKQKGRWKRWHWLSDFINLHGLKTGAELGVKRGWNIFYLLSHCPTLELVHAVDLWEPQPENPLQDYVKWRLPAIYKRVLRDIAALGFESRVAVHKNWTHEAAKEIPDRSLDFIFIDADHRYEAVKRDIITWRSKLKKGGFLAGHDAHFDGVKQALKELYPNYEDTGIDHTWCIKYVL